MSRHSWSDCVAETKLYGPEAGKVVQCSKCRVMALRLKSGKVIATGTHTRSNMLRWGRTAGRVRLRECPGVVRS